MDKRLKIRIFKWFTRRYARADLHISFSRKKRVKYKKKNYNSNNNEKQLLVIKLGVFVGCKRFALYSACNTLNAFASRLAIISSIVIICSAHIGGVGV